MEDCGGMESDNESAASFSNGVQRVKRKRKRKIGVISYETYHLLKQKLSGKFKQVPIPKNLKNIFSKIRRFSLSVKEIHNPAFPNLREEIVDSENKIVLCESEVDTVIRNFYNELRASGARKIKNILLQYYAGVSVSYIQKFIDRQPKKQLQKPVFSNQPKLKPVTSRKPMGRHQIDLVDLSNYSVEHEAETYSYVLSVLDIFTRFLWLRPLPDKSAASVAQELSALYHDFGWGCPKIIQCDQGSEFKGAVNLLCMKMGTKIVRSRSHHPESQGKSERSHQDWKNHLEYDLLRKKEDEDFNWVEFLPAYARIHNESLHSSLNCSPYKAMFGSEPVHFGNILLAGHDVDAYSCSEEDEDVEAEAEAVDNPGTGDMDKRLRELVKFRQSVQAFSKIAADKMIRGNRKKKGSISHYSIGDEVLVREPSKGRRLKRGGKKLGEQKVQEGTVLDIDLPKNIYHIKFSDSDLRWVHVQDITSVTRGKEKDRKEKGGESTASSCKKTEGTSFTKKGKQKMTEGTSITKKGNQKVTEGTSITKKGKQKMTEGTSITKKGKQKMTEGTSITKKGKQKMTEGTSITKKGKQKMTEGTYFTKQEMQNMTASSGSTKTMKDLKFEASIYGMDIVDNTGGGNCMFIAIAQQLQIHDIKYIDHLKLRRVLVDHIRGKAKAYTPFLVKKQYRTFANYCEKMARDGEWGDHLMLLAAADYYDITIRVITTAADQPTYINPTRRMSLRRRKPLQTISIGHLSELHYVTLIPFTEEELAGDEGKDLTSSQAEMKDGKEQDSGSDTEDAIFDINMHVWEQKKEEVGHYLKELASKNVLEERLKRHEEFIISYPKMDKTYNFAQGYISYGMYWKIVQWFNSALTHEPLKYPGKIYSGRMCLFKFEVDERLEKLTRKYNLAAGDYIERVLVKEAILYILTALHPDFTYKIANNYCSETERDMRKEPGRGVKTSFPDIE